MPATRGDPARVRPGIRGLPRCPPQGPDTVRTHLGPGPDEVVEYALARTASPTLVAEYQTALPPKDLLRRKLHELYAQLGPMEEEGEGRRS
jgi:hypothetical protein